MRRYESYKASGVEWLGEIPSHWEILPFKALFKMSDEKNGKNIVGEMLSVSGYRGIEIKKYEFDEQKRTEKELQDYRVVRQGQLVVNTMWLNYAGLGVSDYEGYVSPAYRSYWFDSHLHPQYTHYLLRSHPYIQGYTGQMQGIRPNSLQIKNSDFNKIPILIPPLAEQDHIVNFLDQKTAEIEAAIAKKQRLIELLQEQKSILINQAVTRGLNPNVPMRESGVEWIGEIPAHWKSLRLKILASLITSGPRGWSERLSDDGAVFLQSGNLNNSLGVDTANAHRVIVPKGAEAKRARLQDGDLVVCITGANTGRVALAQIGEQEVYINQHLSLIRLISVNPKFVAYSLSAQGSIYFYICQYGLKEGLSLFDVTNAPVFLPPEKEQEEIVTYLDKAVSKVDIAVSVSLKQCEQLNELKKTLIAHAVTGKIKV